MAFLCLSHTLCGVDSKGVLGVQKIECSLAEIEGLFGGDVSLFSGNIGFFCFTPMNLRECMAYRDIFCVSCSFSLLLFLFRTNTFSLFLSETSSLSLSLALFCIGHVCVCRH